jgi:hypothetical protein
MKRLEFLAKGGNSDNMVYSVFSSEAIQDAHILTIRSGKSSCQARAILCCVSSPPLRILQEPVMILRADVVCARLRTHASCGATKSLSKFTFFCPVGRSRPDYLESRSSCRDSFDCPVLVSLPLILTFGAEHLCMTGKFERTLLTRPRDRVKHESLC